MERTELFDRTVALALLLLLSPLWLVRALAAGASGPWLIAEPRVGRGRREFNLLRFGGELPGGRLARLFNLLRGDIALVGPRRYTPAEAAALPEDAAQLFSVRPGLTSPAGVRQLLGMDYEGELAIALDWIDQRSVHGNLGILARTLFSVLLYGGKLRAPTDTLNFFGLSVINTTMDDALDWIIQRAQGERCTVLQFVNPHCLNVAHSDRAYYAAMQAADRILPDGSGIKLGCRIQGSALRGNLNGTDLFPLLCGRLEAAGLSAFLLGGAPGVAQATADNMRERFAGLKIAGIRDGFFSPDQLAALIQEINASGAAILLVAMGVPRQELWIEAQREHLQVGLAMGVGGCFDFYSGRIPRAPVWLRELGLEWIWRMLQEPGRMWRRYILGNPLFLWRVWRDARRQRAAADSAAR